MEFGSVCAACFVAQLESSDQDVMKTTNILANISLSLCRRDASQTLSRFVTQSGISYASGDFIYLRLEWDQVSSTALLALRIDSISPSQIQPHWGQVSETLNRVDLDSQPASNQALQPTAGRCEVHVDFMKQFQMFATLAAASGGSAPSR